MSSIARKSQSCPDEASYAEAQDWLRCFELLGNDKLSPDQAIQQANKAIELTGHQAWCMPMALALWMNKRYEDALEVLQRPGVEKACGHMAYFYTLVGMVARKVRGKYQIACQAYSVRCKLNLTAMTLSTI